MELTGNLQIVCPIRGQLKVNKRSKDGLTATEEFYRVEAIKFLISKGYPKENFWIEPIIKKFGNSGRNSFRSDFAVLDVPASTINTNGCFRCRVKAGMEKFTPDLLAYLNSEGWGVQMRAFSRGSDGLAEICEDDAKNVIIPLLSDDVRDGLSEYVENLQRGTTTINSVVKQLIKDERIAYNDPDKRPSHIVIV